MDLINDKALDVINYWLDVELSSPPIIKIANANNKNDSRWNQMIYMREGNEDLLWKETLKAKLSYPDDWLHRIYLGIFSTELVIEEFSNDSRDVNELKNTHSTCIISFILDAKGEPVKNTVNIPEYLSSIAYSQNKNRKTSNIFIQKIHDIYAQWSFSISKNKNSVTKNDLKDLLNQILMELKWDILSDFYASGKAEFLAYSESLSLKEHRRLSFDSEITNSLLADDLMWVAEEMKHRDLNSSLKYYLNNKYEQLDKEDLRVDVLRDRECLSETLSPDLFPMAAWPLNNGKNLVLSQQFAVNKIFQELEYQNGIFSVNGPPGTGKTTLLKDIIANIIFKRACAIYEFRDNPKDAFTTLGNITYKFSVQGEKQIYSLDPSLQGFEIVVASSNNGAVQNITNELPLFSEIEEKYHVKMKYFSETATNINSHSSWGLISASLGNKKNNFNFINNFSFNNYYEKGGSSRSFFEFLKNPRYFNETIMSWKEACMSFKVKKDKVEFYRNQLNSLYHCLYNYNDNLKIHKEIQDELRLQINKRTSLISAIETQKLTLDRLLLELEKENRKKEKMGKKGIMKKIYSASDELEVEEKIEELKDTIVDEKNLIQTKLIELKELEDTIRSLQSTYNEHKMMLLKIQEVVKVHGEKINPTIPNENFWKSSDITIQHLSPWMNRKLQEARIELFIASLDLHKSFIIENSDKITSNLKSLKEVLDNDFHEKDIYSEAILKTLFLVVPVISTTFHSLGKVFQSLKEESIGWLLIDEAGQASPQSPVGGLYRAKRAIFVGDPLQVEPVVHIEEKLSDVLMDKNYISKAWNSCKFSAQQIADRNNVWGANLGIGENRIWVGAPLRVHRRCNNPMFSISNKIAYDNSMIYGKNEEQTIHVIEKSIGKSCWFDLEGESSNESHWIKIEGELVMSLLRKIQKDNPDKLPNLYIISPFKSVAYELYKTLLKNREKWASNLISDDDLSVWINRSVGTIHAFQGKESDSVILVLGGNVNKPGAINWVCEEPNILNVAATRARNSFYIIGNSKIWNKGVFGLIRNMLPIKSQKKK